MSILDKLEMAEKAASAKTGWGTLELPCTYLRALIECARALEWYADKNHMTEYAAIFEEGEVARKALAKLEGEK